MSILSEHFYRGRLPWTKEGRVDILTHVGELKDSIRKKAEGHRKLQASLPNLHGKLMPITMDEWNYWHRDYVYGELGCVYDLADGLGTAEGLHEYFRQSDLIHMAHYAQTVNVIGAIKTSRTAAEMESTGLVLELYRAKFGSIPLKIGDDFGNLDIAAALSADGSKLTIGVVNPTNDEVTVSPKLTGAEPQGAATRWDITGPDETAHNTPGKPRVIDIHESAAKAASLVVPALSCAVFEIPLK